MRLVEPAGRVTVSLSPLTAMIPPPLPPSMFAPSRISSTSPSWGST